MDDDTPDDTPLVTELQALRAEVHRLNIQRHFQIDMSFWKQILLSLVRGLAYGFGSVLGATILVAIAVKVLGTIDFIPVLGDWAQQIITEIQTHTPPK